MDDLVGQCGEMLLEAWRLPRRRPVQIRLAQRFEKLQVVPLLIITPLTFLGGTFYSVNVLPPAWQTVALCNPVVYLISGFRWSFFETADVSVGLSLGMTVLFLAVCMATVWVIFKTGYRLKK